MLILIPDEAEGWWWDFNRNQIPWLISKYKLPLKIIPPIKCIPQFYTKFFILFKSNKTSVKLLSLPLKKRVGKGGGWIVSYLYIST